MPPAAKKQRVKIALPDPEAKAFTSEGPALSGSVLELPEAEARRFVERGVAVPALETEELNKLAPSCDVEAAANNPNAHGSYKVAHQREAKVNADNAAPREAE